MVLYRDCGACFAGLNRGDDVLWLNATVPRDPLQLDPPSDVVVVPRRMLFPISSRPEPPLLRQGARQRGRHLLLVVIGLLLLHLPHYLKETSPYPG